MKTFSHTVSFIIGELSTIHIAYINAFLHCNILTEGILLHP